MRRNDTSRHPSVCTCSKEERAEGIRNAHQLDRTEPPTQGSRSDKDPQLQPPAVHIFTHTHTYAFRHYKIGTRIKSVIRIILKLVKNGEECNKLTGFVENLMQIYSRSLQRRYFDCQNNDYYLATKEPIRFIRNSLFME
ncbi:hypothetical protein TSAR_006704 [Trichomalopsis sarcophagae]|uniref:Uncharacterized protein n=1 Tax=Trichomalopsis sarcophagae TaxID=543379 RepID=A0A232EJB8_9HYME|nr:hypothetical protein TSAR_006704 [Trichomalopsis sarcophagae]